MSEDCPHCLYDKTHENCPGCWEGSHYKPKPSLPRPIYSPVDHYDVDVATGTVTYHVVTTNGDRIRSMTDEELASVLLDERCSFCDANNYSVCNSTKRCHEEIEAWLKEEVKDG